MNLIYNPASDTSDVCPGCKNLIQRGESVCLAKRLLWHAGCWCNRPKPPPPKLPTEAQIRESQFAHLRHPKQRSPRDDEGGPGADNARRVREGD